MAINFKDLRRGSTSSFQKLQQEVEKMGKFTKSVDERFWQPTVDKEGNGSAVIRFLPAAEGEEIPFTRLYSHGFKGPTGKWYIENSRTTLGEADPVSELNSKLWNHSQDDDSLGRKMARAQKRQLHYISNVYVVRDGANSENEGKVFLYRYGTKIWDKANSLMHPKFEEDKAINPFDMWTGANLRLRICKVKGYRNYDESQFAPASQLDDDDDVMEKIWHQCHLLIPLTAPDQFKSYGDLEKQLYAVIGNTADFVLGAAPTEHKESAPAQHQKSTPVREEAAHEPELDTGDSDDLPWNDPKEVSMKADAKAEVDDVADYFKKLMNE